MLDDLFYGEAKIADKHLSAVLALIARKHVIADTKLRRRTTLSCSFAAT